MPILKKAELAFRVKLVQSSLGFETQDALDWMQKKNPGIGLKKPIELELGEFDSNDFTFKIIKNKEKNPDERAWIFWAYLHENVGIEYNYYKKEYSYYAIKVDDKYGIMSWRPNEGCWKPQAEIVQEAYLNHLAEKELLDDK